MLINRINQMLDEAGVTRSKIIGLEHILLLEHNKAIVGEIGEDYCIVNGVYYSSCQVFEGSPLCKLLRLKKLKAFW